MKILIAGCLCALLWCSGHAATTATPRFLVAVDTSFSTSKRSDAIRNIAADLVTSGFGGQIRPGERFEIWSFSERIQKLAIFDWKEELGAVAMRSVELALARQRRRGLTDFTLLTESVSAVARISPVFTFILLTDGEDSMVGTPYDGRINRAFAEGARISKRDRQPFVVAMLAENGVWTRCAVSAGGLHIEIPAPAPPDQAKPAPEVPAKLLEITGAAVPPAANPTIKVAEPPANTPTPAVSAASKPPVSIPSPAVDSAAAPPKTPPTSSREPAPALVPSLPATDPNQSTGKPASVQGQQPASETDSAGSNSNSSVTPVSTSVPPVEPPQNQVSDSPSGTVPKDAGGAGTVLTPSTPPPEPLASSPSDAPEHAKTQWQTTAVAEALLTPPSSGFNTLRFWLVGGALLTGVGGLLFLGWIRGRSQSVGQSSLISQSMEKGGGHEPPGKR